MAGQADRQAVLPVGLPAPGLGPLKEKLRVLLWALTPGLSTPLQPSIWRPHTFPQRNVLPLVPTAGPSPGVFKA